MKKLTVCLFLFFSFAKDSLATEWASYFIYVQKEYIQGPWKRAAMLVRGDSYAYLHPLQFEELFGSEEVSLANSIFRHLKEETPERYTFRSTLSISADTVVIQTPDSIADFAVVRNELTASFVLNNFAAVKIIRQGASDVYQLKDITVPYMDLVLPATAAMQELQNPDRVLEDTTASANQPPSLTKEKSANSMPVWLLVSLLLNFVLLILLLRKRR